MKSPASTERHFPLHSRESAPQEARPAIDWYQSNFGMVPNLTRLMAESPALLLSYWQSQQNLLKHTSLTKQEMNIVQTAVANENECQYCVAAHTAFGHTDFFDNTEEQLEAVRTGRKFDDQKLNALRDFTLIVLENKGRVSSAQLDTFLNSGYTRAQALDVVANIAVKVMSNYANQIAIIPVDEPFEPYTEGLSYKVSGNSLAS